MGVTSVNPQQAALLTLAAIRSTALYQPEVDMRSYVTAITADIELPERRSDDWCSDCWTWGDHECGGRS